MTHPALFLRQLRVIQAGRPAYEQSFHKGVNIIRGENGSGKSTIADFIFYVLGGEFEDWKDAAQQCDEVQAEVETSNGVLTIRRSIGGKLEPPTVFYGDLKTATTTALEGWHRHPLRRTQDSLSFSQLMFRSCGIPEAPRAGRANSGRGISGFSA